jgi:hypothetical protein
MIRPSLVFALIATLAGAPFAQNTAAPKASAEATKAAPGKAGFRELNWDDLLPKDWDPYKDLKDLKLAGLSDGDPRAAAMLKRMREVWDNAPVNNQLADQAVRLPGYLVPLEESKAGLNEFLLVPYFGACIHTPPPPSNQIVHVLPRQTLKGFHSMDTVWVNGTMKTVRSDTAMGASSYRLEAVSVEPYVEKPK